MHARLEHGLYRVAETNAVAVIAFQRTRTVWLAEHLHDIYSSDCLSLGVDGIKILENLFLIWNSHIKAGEVLVSGQHLGHAVNRLDFKIDISRVDFLRLKLLVEEILRERVPQREPNQSEQAFIVAVANHIVMF